MLYRFVKGDKQNFNIMVQHIMLTLKFKPTIFNAKMAMKGKKMFKVSLKPAKKKKKG
jgi:hypothetical protein